LRIIALAFVATLLGGLSSPGDTQPKKVRVGESFDLRLQEWARVEAEDLEVGFSAVVADSRCPRGEQCVWEGDATVRIWVRKADATKQAYELHTSPKAAVAVAHLDYAVRLVRLLPHPTSGRQPAQKDYTATLEVTRGAPPSPDAVQ